MAKYKLQEMPDMNGMGKKRVYPKMVVERTMGTEELIDKLLHYNRTIPKSAILAVVNDIGWIMSEMLADGYNVKLDGIGMFSLSLDFNDDKQVELEHEEDRMTHRKVAVKDVNYKTDPELVKQLDMKVHLTRDMGGVKRLRKSKYTAEEREARALDVMDRQGFITLGEYATLNGLSRTMASRELNELVHADNPRITTHGRGTHKVWIRIIPED